MPFEMVLQGSPSVPRLRQASVFTVTVAFHAALLCALIVRSAWQVDELESPMISIPLHQIQLPKRDTASGGAKDCNRGTRTNRPKREPRLTANETKAVVTPPVAPPPEDADDGNDNAGVQADRGNGSDGPTGLGDGKDDVDGVDFAVPVTAAMEPVIRPPTVVANSCVHCPQPHVPPALLSVAGNLRFMAKLCINTQGNVDKITVMRGLSEAVTSDIVATLSAWRYQPYAVNGNPVPFCFVASFLFKSE